MATIDPTPEYVAQLLSIVHSKEELRAKGFVLKALSVAELLKKARCNQCNKRPRKSGYSKSKHQPNKENSSQMVNKNETMTDLLDVNNKRPSVDQDSAENNRAEYMHENACQDNDIAAYRGSNNTFIYTQQRPSSFDTDGFGAFEAQPYDMTYGAGNFNQMSHGPMMMGMQNGTFPDGLTFPVFGTPSTGMDPMMTNMMYSMNHSFGAHGADYSMMNSTYPMSNAFDPPDPRIETRRHSTAELTRSQSIRCFNCRGLGHKAFECPIQGDDNSKVDENAPKPPCQWHPGARRGRIYLCCRAHVSTPGCRTALSHSLPSSPTPALTVRFQVHVTPTSHPTNDNTTTATNPPTPNSNKALAVALDCEMGTAHDGEPELIRVTLIDYFSGAVLLDSLVWPDVGMEHFNTRYSGVTGGQMRAARRDRTCLFGVAAARRAVWRHVGPETIVVGHDVKNDFSALRWAHGVVVDSMLVEAAARRRALEPGAGGDEAADCKLQGGQDSDDEIEKPKAPGLSLKSVSMLRLGRDIQKRTHDSLEDALASRDIAHHHVVAGMA